ncbi:hypothetical protein PFICI_05430 [Pestalotiopsis fici W106-1]|uniref:C3H1-type domain-containing protein n=1 Tax=Pestalotiopsis fici (strain W106-1 / CGMCC3.15140) TaxID=1229662 RepID=W3XC05_PESFW|nr:uncharacterized protein PFICI_05430 [Pestalotiopsis fici W106-1]ETS83554.1 hypothetical protein PFICI_05430 [Pestalotiopsis fici W106-1]
MLFEEEDAPHLKAWIIKRLENTSDADADVLADYVIALLKHDADVHAIRKLFEEEIPDFLREESAPFTDDVFQAIKYKSYLPGAPPAPPISRQAPKPTPQAPKIPSGPAALQKAPFQSHDVQHTPYAETPTAFASHSFRNGSKKRSYRDLDAPDPQVMSWDYGGGPPQQQPYKQAKRGGGLGSRGGRYDDPNSSRGRGGFGGYNGGLPNAGANGFPGSGYNNQQFFDATAIMENIRQLQELGAQMGLHLPSTDALPKPAYSGQAMPASSRRRRGQCREYETKGFCSRGTNCQYEHGNSSAFVPPFQPPSTDEYDPNNAAMGMLEHPGQPVKPLDMPFLQMPQPTRREPKKPKRKGGRSAIAAEGPSHDKTNTKIVVENIPEENFTEDAVREFFTEFGSVQEIELRPTAGTQKRIAVVKYNDWTSANAAWKSPKVVFDNRFVKVYWFKDESQLVQDKRHPKGDKNGSSNGDIAMSEPDFDIEDFKRKQEEAQKIHLEKQQKREELDRQRQELEEKQKELIARQQEARRELQEKLAANGVREDSLSPILSKATLDGEQPSQAEALRAKLAALEEEANSLGLDPDANDDSFSWSSYRGRGRRPYRARGGTPSRGWQGSYRGRGGGATQDVHAAYAAYSLDNRPRIIAISGVDFTDPVKDEALKQYLFGIGEFADIHTDSSATHITFKDRKTAEQFMFGVSGQKAVPGVEGEVELSWASSAPKTTEADNDLSGAHDEQDTATNQEEETEEHSGFGRPSANSQYDMDYEGGDWGAS